MKPLAELFAQGRGKGSWCIPANSLSTATRVRLGGCKATDARVHNVGFVKPLVCKQVLLMTILGQTPEDLVKRVLQGVTKLGHVTPPFSSWDVASIPARRDAA